MMRNEKQLKKAKAKLVNVQALVGGMIPYVNTIAKA